MPVKHIIRSEPEQAQALKQALDKLGITFDPQENLCAMPPDNIEDHIFMGNDLDWLPAKANEYLEENGISHRFRTDMEEMDNIQAQYSFLALLTTDSDWEDEETIAYISPRNLQEFSVEYPEAMGQPNS